MYFMIAMLSRQFQHYFTKLWSVVLIGELRLNSPLLVQGILVGFVNGELSVGLSMVPFACPCVLSSIYHSLPCATPGRLRGTGGPEDENMVG